MSVMFCCFVRLKLLKLPCKGTHKDFYYFYYYYYYQIEPFLLQNK